MRPIHITEVYCFALFSVGGDGLHLGKTITKDI
ncbi:TPA: hypothetical protein I7284_00855 [Vibrio parahaemolyticus]|nr:hypothetical protein [Vibrio parahaemolyticus]